MSKIQIDANFNGKPIDVLEKLIQQRVNALQETTRRATIATAIQVFNSLKADAKRAPLKGNRKMYTIERTGLSSSWLRTTGGGFRRVVRSSYRGHIDWDVTRRCRNLEGQRFSRGESVAVWKVQLFNENMNETVYYAHSRNEKKVRDYIERIILARMLAKEAGMAKYAIAMAQARVSDRPMTSVASGSKQFKMAREAGQIQVSSDSFNSGKSFVRFFDALRYSTFAQKSGNQSVEIAMMKAANKVAGIIRKDVFDHPYLYDLGGYDGKWEPPFPEVASRKRS